MKNYYEILEISQDATLVEIKTAYRRLVLQWHPDKNLDNKELAEETFKEVVKAYKILSDPSERELYNDYLARHHESMEEFVPLADSSYSNLSEIIAAELDLVREQIRKYDEELERNNRVLEKVREWKELSGKPIIVQEEIKPSITPVNLSLLNGKWSWGDKLDLIGGTKGDIFDPSSGKRIRPDDNDYGDKKIEIIKSIKNSSADWVVKKLIDGYTGQEETFLVHDSFNLIQNSSVVLKDDTYGKVHWKKGFTRTEWADISSFITKESQNRYQYFFQVENGR